MTPQSSGNTDYPILSFIKELSGKLIERRRRRDRISQQTLAGSIGRSDRWVRELEGGAGTSALEDHIRCAHALRMSTIHVTIPLLAMEHNMATPHELLLQDDLWQLEQELLEVIARHQSAAVARLAAQRGAPGRTDR
ncbi:MULTISPECIES: helix-turn-helix domain-containing protein [Sphingobium]|uniref:Uncharacterized protein n=1 Tax=Sphingobium lactosutens DS20 TaxID=1331060 RepID=T0HEV7_9SPHN|nr:MULTISPECIES: hypothetical protein [Sphingobium]EQB14866.1 hypothetical protein RLDS_11905 [Sphingobium lactosutens DS20]